MATGADFPTQVGASSVSGPPIEFLVEGTPTPPASAPPSRGAVISIFAGAIIFTGAMVFLVYGLQNNLPIDFVASIPSSGGAIGIALMALGIYLNRRNEAQHAKASSQDLTQWLEKFEKLKGTDPIVNTLSTQIALLRKHGGGGYIVSKTCGTIIVRWKKKNLHVGESSENLYILNTVRYGGIQTLEPGGLLDQLDSHLLSNDKYRYARIQG